MQIPLKNKRYLPSVAGTLLKYSGDRRLFAFYGSLGAGKTTIIKAICKLLGASDPVSSPTFTIVNEYRTADGQLLYHIDFYRIKKYEEVLDLGIEEYLSAGSYCFMEWPEIIEEMLPADTVKIKITPGKNEERLLEIV
ncbi:MAG: tRNA (adenosine(37)-N6)-threonylcarbamoyltransferase complex ATPase subunit type 1 TsaE [Bacteroidales bacterium]|nr:tRNA (adenosine(37)-N6)-threonylcarbamoyltransferase complex ATPase subunit type 1 TsaE [Bacteroidales bacterium]